MKNQKGITLIALVVTIVVLLILAAVSIAMLRGDSGIITNANKAKYANVQGEVTDKMNMAYSAVKTEIKVKQVEDRAYVATDNVDKLANLVIKELGGTEELSAADTFSNKIGDGYKVKYDSSNVITIAYDDPKTFSATSGAPYGAIQCTIKIEADDATLDPKDNNPNKPYSEAQEQQSGGDTTGGDTTGGDTTNP